MYCIAFLKSKVFVVWNIRHVKTRLVKLGDGDNEKPRLNFERESI